MSIPLTYKWNIEDNKWENKDLESDIKFPDDSFLNWNEILYYIPPNTVHNRKVGGKWAKISNRGEIFTLAETPGDDSGSWQWINKPQRPVDIKKSNIQQMSEEDNQSQLREQQEKARRQVQATPPQLTTPSVPSPPQLTTPSVPSPPQLTTPSVPSPPQLIVPEETPKPYLDAVRRNGTVYVVPRVEKYEKIIPEMKLTNENIANMICGIVNQHTTTKNKSSKTVERVDKPGIIVNKSIF
jgi:hypothetical protein